MKVLFREGRRRRPGRRSARGRRVLSAALALLAIPALAQDPFEVSVSATAVEAGTSRVTVAFGVPTGHHLYADQLSFTASGATVSVANAPAPAPKHDAFSEQERGAYERDFRIVYALAWETESAAPATLRYQGCSESVCFRPAEKRRPPVSSDIRFKSASLGPKPIPP